MRPKSIALLLLALGCGLVASIGITQVIGHRNSEPVSSGEAQPIFVAMCDINVGDTLSPQVVKLEPWPKDKVPPGAITRVEDIEGRRARTKLYANEPILENRLLGKGASAQGASALIPPGYRTVPVKVDLVSGGSSMIMPGDRVDVMGHFVQDANRGIPETVTRTILQDTKVFAVDDVVDLEHEKDGAAKSIQAKTISLLVTPDQAALVMMATQLGVINLVMRSPDDDSHPADSSARPSQLFAGPAKNSNRGNENLMPGGDESLADKGKSLLDVLGSMKNKPGAQANAASKPVDVATPETWKVRVLKPDAVEEIEFQAEPTKSASASTRGGWKLTAMVGGDRSAVMEPKSVEPPPEAQEPDAQPAIEPVQDKVAIPKE